MEDAGKELKRGERKTIIHQEALPDWQCLAIAPDNPTERLTHMSLVIEGQITDGKLLADVGVNRLDAASSRDFKKQVEALWSSEVKSVEFDFSTVDFIDSSGVGALLGVYKKLPEGGASVRLRNVKAPVQSVIELLRLHRIFEIVS